MAREIFSKDPQAFNIALADALKNIPEIQSPEWAFFVKTGVSRQRIPESPTFWQTRAASILRQLYINGVVGVERLRTRYGGRKNRGARPAKFKKSSGKMIRLILQQCEKAGLVETVKDKQFGRRLTQKGRDFLDSIKVADVKIRELADYIGKDKVIIEQEINEEIAENGNEAQSEE